MTDDEGYHAFESATGAEIKLCLQQPVMPELAVCKKKPLHVVGTKMELCNG